MVRDNTAWLELAEDVTSQLIHRETGFFGVASGTNLQRNPHAVVTCSSNNIFTNGALTPDGDVWWEDLPAEPPPELIDGQGQPQTPKSGRPAAHPNARFTFPGVNSPSLDAAWNDLQRGQSRFYLWRTSGQ